MTDMFLRSAAQRTLVGVALSFPASALIAIGIYPVGHVSARITLLAGIWLMANVVMAVLGGYSERS